MKLVIENNILISGVPESEHETLVIPDTVTEIGEKAFWRESKLCCVRIPGSVKKIGKSAFESCGSIQELRLEEGLEEIGDRAFAGAFYAEWVDDDWTLIDDIVFPKSLKRIGKAAFKGLNCEKVILPEGLLCLGKGAFAESNMRHVYIPGSLKEIPVIAFASCLDLHDVEIGPGVETIGFEAFSGCNELQTLTIAPGLKRIESNAFRCCMWLKEVVLPEGLLELEDSAFYGCEDLVRVVFPSTLKCIGSDPHIPLIGELESTWDEADLHLGVFAQCSNLREVVIPEGVEKIGFEAFFDCPIDPEILKPFMKLR